MRYSRTIREQLDVVEMHINWKVKQLVRYSKRCAKLQKDFKEGETMSPELETTLIKMYSLAKDLEPVASWLKQSWPEAAQLYETSLTLVKEQ